MVDVQDEPSYSGYSDTATVRRMSGTEDQEDDYPNSVINDTIKAIEIFINTETSLPEGQSYPLPVNAALKMATSFLASAVIKNMKPEETDGGGTDSETDLQMGMMFLTSFMNGNILALTSRFGFMFLSDYQTNPANPNVRPYMTSRPRRNVSWGSVPDPTSVW
jgi:hypothetical protein